MTFVQRHRIQVDNEKFLLTSRLLNSKRLIDYHFRGIDDVILYELIDDSESTLLRSLPYISPLQIGLGLVQDSR
ncbi:hypothetical protein D9M71_749840 [compost metagenome]